MSVANNQALGVWIQNLRDGQSVTLAGVHAIGNAGIGIGVASGSTGVTVRNCEVATTLAKTWPVLNPTPSSATIAYGFAWNDRAGIVIDGLDVHGNAIVGLLVTGTWADGSAARNVRVAAGDHAPVVVQGRTDGALPPGLESVASSLVTSTPAIVYPIAPASPPPH